jgi:hypothetical protein
MNLKRITACTVLLLAGIGSVLYGSLFHVVAVEEEKEREVSILVPTMSGVDESPAEQPGADAAAPPGSDEADPFHTPSGNEPQQGNSENPFDKPPLPPPMPGMKTEKVTEKYVESSEDPEWMIVRDVTVGGVVRLANGQLKRTYSGKPPALCPS